MGGALLRRAPLAALFQVGYAESLFLLWLFLSLWLVMKRRFGWLYLLIPLMAFTRPGVLAFGLFLALFGIWRWFSRRHEPLAPAEIVHIVALGLLAVVTGFSWQVIAGVVTGDPGAYLATELAWRRNWMGDTGAGFLPFDGFVQGAGFWFESWGLGAVTGYIVLAASVAGVAALLLFEPHVRRMGVESRLWSASYLALSARGVLPSVEHLPAARCRSRRCGEPSRCRARDLADRRAGSRACSANGGGSTTCMHWATRTGRSRESGAGDAADYPLS